MHLSVPFKPMMVAAMLLSWVPLSAQTTIEVGSGTQLNNAVQSPSPYANIQPGGRIQMLFPADELQAAGMSAGLITGLGFKVQEPSGTTFSDYTIRLGTTGSATLDSIWETGMTEVWGPQNFTDGYGWSSHTFATPFSWDGQSNLVVETCFLNPTSTQNASVFRSTTIGYVGSSTRSTYSSDVCTGSGGTHLLWQSRPNARFQWLDPDGPPLALPVASPTFSCTGTISFSDQGTAQNDTWQWDFGDGGTATEENVAHSYTADGTYTVTLVVTNAFGSDTAQITVTVGLAPIPMPICAAPSSVVIQGFGILDVNVEGVPHPSGDAASEGYLDNTCPTANVLQGTPLHVEITTATAAGHAVRAWVDWDNSGSFAANELIALGTGPYLSVAALVPTDAALGVPLRMRVIAAYDLVSPSPTPCDTVRFGQAEDYSITVQPNPEPPTPLLSANPAFSCDGNVQFTDLSLNAPTAWAWDFGDGGTSIAQSPAHQYASSGIYSVSLSATNANGQGDTTYTDLVTVDLAGMLLPAECTPNTQAACCGYGILGFQFADISSASPDGSEGYQDRSCGNTAHVQEGQAVIWSVVTGDESAQDIRIWIDLNNDGSFTTDELFVTALNMSSPTGTGIIPEGPVYGTPLRMRVQADVVGQSVGSCDAPLYGQTEDFSAVITPNLSPPQVDFSAWPTTTCDGFTQFSDLSTHVPTSWLWSFGDGNTSDEQNPGHTYATLGQFTVTLTASNAFGANTLTKYHYIRSVVPSECDTLAMPMSGHVINTQCSGVLADDGGPYGFYTRGISGAFTVSPPGATTVILQFSQFLWGYSDYRSLRIFDGPSIYSPLLADLFGDGLPQPGGIVQSTGPSITVQQYEHFYNEQPTGPGFLLSWNCSTTGIAERPSDPIGGIHPVPARERFTVELIPQPGEERTLTLVDVNGRTVLERTFSGELNSITVERGSLPAGAYAVRLRTPSGQWVRTIILQ